ncbi:NUDIX hydrolase [Parasediminibacterium sp. JCM 36343]|uniref:NUDIX hydrolase n=1 Tax=Parasediminibacterium sp. JCM 36343 TaxID=3374279 RepID=UPI00397A5926
MLVLNVDNVAAFTIRVYGLLIDSQKRVLVSDEYVRGHYFTKFPGGGLEFGEGTRECLKREFKEETGLDVEIGEHIYTTDYYQKSAFNSTHQMVAIYYFVQAKDPILLETKTIPFDFAPEQTADPNGQSEVRRWIALDKLTEDDLHLPIDKIVVRLLKKDAQKYNLENLPQRH